jgi:hypothetical protein
MKKNPHKAGSRLAEAWNRGHSVGRHGTLIRPPYNQADGRKAFVDGYAVGKAEKEASHADR